MTFTNGARGRANRRAWLIAGASLTALAFTASGAAAQGAAAEAVEEVVVTGSRITSAGFTAPTPVTVSTAEQLKISTPLVVEGLEDLPMLEVSGTRANGTGGAGGGQATINLRALGSSRVLVMLDGRRVAPERANGEVNVSLMPNPLISRVDVVTGGASAAYGSDAVAGVVNFILDKKFVGIRGNVYGGISEYGDRTEFGGEVGFGVSFANDRAHFLTSLDYTDQNGFRWDDRPGPGEGYMLITNPVAGGRPTQFRAENARFDTGSGYGLVTTGPLKGVTFDPDGTWRQFNYGSLASGGRHIGGEGEVSVVGPGAIIVGWQNRGGMFNRLSYDVSDTVTVFAENQLAWTKNLSGIGWGYSIGATGFTIRQDNAFLSPTLRARMVAQNIQSFRVDRYNADFPNNDIETKSFKWRPVFGAEFSIGDWDGEVSFSPTYSKRRLVYRPGMDQIRSLEAADAVIDPATGRIVCRKTLTNTTFQGTGCTPLNVMGAASPEAIKAIHRDNAEWNQDVFKQQNFSASINGPLFELPAGTVSAATGVDYRHEDVVFTSDAYSQVLNPFTNALGGWRAGSAQPFSGTQAVKEIFVEVAAPLMRDMPMVSSLEVNGAARVTDYRTSGTVTTWKLGVMYRPIEGLLIRGTRSHDIRAPSLSELYNAGTAGTAVIRDPFLNNITYGGVKTASTGNPELTPEIGDTTVIGLTYQPAWLPGLNLAADLWKIELSDAIGSIGTQAIIDECFANRSAYECTFITRDSANVINSIRNVPINFSERFLKGIDYEVGYRTRLGWLNDANLSLRLVATQLHDNYTNSRGTIDHSAGEIGDPKWRGLAQATLSTQQVSATLSARYTGPVVYDRRYTSGVEIDDNTVGSYTTFDARLGYKLPWTPGIEAYVSVANLLDRQPPRIYHDGGTVPLGTNTGAYDIIGRYYRTGVSFKF